MSVDRVPRLSSILLNAPVVPTPLVHLSLTVEREGEETTNSRKPKELTHGRCEGSLLPLC